MTQQSDGSVTPTPAFQEVPSGANTSTWSQSGVQLLLTGPDLFPFNESQQAVLLTILSGAFEQAGVPYIWQYQSAGVRTLVTKSFRTTCMYTCVRTSILIAAYRWLKWSICYII